MSGFKKIIVAVDGSPNSLQAARVAARLADGMRAELVLLHCFPMMSDDIAGALGMSTEDIIHTRDSAARRASIWYSMNSATAIRRPPRWP